MGYRHTDLRYCCTATLLYDFGESEVSEGGPYESDFETELSNTIDIINRYLLFRDKACLMAITNSEQSVANKVFTTLKFRHSAWMTKDAHKETKIRIWWLPLDKVNSDKISIEDYI